MSVRKIADTGHAEVGPSKLARALRCPGSVAFLADIEDDAGIPAAEGTILHSFCEDALTQNILAEDFIGECREHDGHRYTLNEVDAELMQDGLDRLDMIPGKLFVEKRLDLDRFMPGQYGTMDVGIMSLRSRVAHVWDWKWGYVPVDPVRNEQAMAYALGFWDNFIRGNPDYEHIDQFRIHICQPRTVRGGGEWDVSLEDLLAFGREIKPKVAMCFEPDAPRVPGEVQCKYCDGARSLTCPEYKAFNLQALIDDFDEMDERWEMGLGPRLPELTPDRRSFLIENRPMFEKFFDRIENEALDDFIKGRPVPRFKAVEGRRPPRKWNPADEDAVRNRLEKALGEDAYTRKLLSPTQAEKELPPRLFGNIEEYVAPSERKSILVSEDDAREPIQIIDDEFDDLD
ncbi:MAG TPA: DUF2800 domain-containing protein [Aurantimonas coralicida]|nr:DUF2800 domain-containing protein [Aurantimonas coralicida]